MRASWVVQSTVPKRSNVRLSVVFRRIQEVLLDLRRSPSDACVDANNDVIQINKRQQAWLVHVCGPLAVVYWTTTAVLAQQM